MKKLLTLLLASIAVTSSYAQTPRTIVTTDGEVDDQDSFIRLLLYANEFRIDGLIYSSSQWHYKGDGKGTKFKSEMAMTEKRYGERTELRWPGTTWMEEMIEKYRRVYPNLVKHDKRYPTADQLKSLVRVGNIDFEGEMAKDTEGSDFIKKILLDNSTEPIYLQVWGGTNTIARALKSIEDEYSSKSNWKDIKQKVSDKAIIYAVLDQDATYKKYVAPNWPAIKVLYNANQFWNFAYPWPRVVPAELQPYLRGPWFKENIKTGHGPLLETYYLWGDGTQIQGDDEHSQGDPAELEKFKMTAYDFISEGDSPAYFHLVDVGLRNMEDASYGGWGGRMVRSTNPYRWEDGDAATDYNPFTKKMDKAYPQTRWIDVLQNDFAARADWCVNDYKNANHAPTVKVDNKDVTAFPNQTITITGSSTDPDKNKVTYKWWQYFEVDTYEGKIEFKTVSGSKATFVVPADAKSGDTIHVILEATDNGVPALTRYQRVIVTVK
ncbi:MAG TPA: nucleoside hydrolase-like domain-containing protein [Cyclobacteriaceae bacterium]|nr:nucleoside hydrolase-like domain-containing protein [Cyclobacteriaceae bacterium]